MLLDVVSHYDLSVLSMSVIVSLDGGGGWVVGVSSMYYVFVFLDFV